MWRFKVLTLGFISFIALSMLGAKPAAAQTLSRYPSGTITFPNTAVGSTSLPQIVQIDNTGGIGTSLNIGTVTLSSATNYTIVSDTCSGRSLVKVIANNSATCVVLVAYRPADASGPDTANLVVTSNSTGGSPTNIPLSGNPSGGTSLTAVPNVLNFGSQLINTSTAPKYTEIRNTGTTTISNLVVSALGGSNPGDFAPVQDGCNGQTLAPGASCTIQHLFKPTTVNPALSATYTVTGTASPALGSAITVTLNGAGVQPIIGDSGDIAFGGVMVGTIAGPSTVTVTNISAVADLHIGNINHADAVHFVISSDTCSNSTVPKGGANTCSFKVSFLPDSATTFNDTVNIPNDSSVSPDQVDLSGTGTLGSLSSDGPVSFSNVPVGTLAGPTTVTITNNDLVDSVTLGNLHQIGTDTDKFFLSSDTCSNQVLAALATCTFDVNFQTAAVGSFSDTILVPNNTATPSFPVLVSGNTVQPVIGLSPDVAFGSVPVNTTAGPSTVTVTNTSTFADLHIGSVAQVGGDTTHFAIVNDNCSNKTVAAGGSNTCTFQVTFSPTDTTALSGSILIPNDSANSNPTVGVSGTGEQASISASPDLTFTDVPVNTASAPQTVTITNTSADVDLHIDTLTHLGSNPDRFVIANDTCSHATIAAGGSNTCTFDVVFTPNAVASFTDTILVPNDSSAPNLMVDLSGNGVGPAISDSGDVSFGSVAVGSTGGPVTVTISNTATVADLHIGSLVKIGANPTNFAIANDTCSNATVAAGDDCTFDVTFTPTSNASFSDTVLVPNDSVANPSLTVDLDGDGSTASVVSNSPIDFGTIAIKTSSTKTVTLTNQDTVAAAVLGNLVKTGSNTGNFIILNDNCSGATVAANGGTCTFDVTFTPDAEASFSDSVLVPIQNVGSITVSLLGDGESPTISTSGSVDFGDVPVGTTANPITVTVTNDDTVAELHIGTLVKVGENANLFTIVNDNCSDQTVAVDGGTCTFDVIFSPNAADVFFDEVLIPSDAASGNEFVDIEGTGVQGGLLSSGSGAFGNVNVGAQGGPNTITVTNASSTVSVHIGNLQQVGANPNQFSLQNDNCSNATLAPNDHCTFQAVFRPTAAGPFSDKVLVPNDSDTPNFSINLSGTGVVPGVAVAVFNPTVLDFDLDLDKKQSGASESQTTTITNAGAQPLQIASVGISGANAGSFTQTNNCDGQTLATNASCTITVTFASNAEGDFNAALTVTSNSAGTPFVVLLGSARLDASGGCSLNQGHDLSTPIPLACAAIASLLGLAVWRRRLR